MSQILQDVQALYEKNRRTVFGHQYTIPSPELYPFQWLWDSCFHAITLSHFDLAAAKKELRSAFSRPMPNGLLPHIIYWEYEVSQNNWGREMRGDVINKAWGVQGTSAITQPPIMAYALWRVYQLDGDKEFAEEQYKVLETYFSYLENGRTFNGDSIAYIINPDESGEDNSPRFDLAQSLPPIHDAPENLDRRIERMRENATCMFNAKECMSKYFGVADVSFNVLYAQDLDYMSKLAAEFGYTTESNTFTQRAHKVREDMKSQMKNGCVFFSYDHLLREPIRVYTWNIFMPLYGGLLEKDEAQQLVDEYYLNKDMFYTPHLLPTTAKTEPSYDPDGGFWRGPIWIGANYFIYHGLKRYGFDDLAQELKAHSIRLLQQSGFREQYHPETGEGQGAHDFTWGGLVIDME